jgi:DNA-binding XRE family transcriptional regulator
MIKEKLTTLDDFEAELLQDPEFRKEYESLKPKFEMISHLIERRNLLKLSQTQLAKMVGMRQPAISRLERGDYNTTLGTLVKVIDALGLDLDISPKAELTTRVAEKRTKYSTK